MKLGLIQGRLSLPNEGFQDTPTNWQAEFEKLKQLNLNHIEWIITKDSFHSNPFFTENLKGLPIHSVCADNLVDSKIDNLDFVLSQLEPICSFALKNEIKYVTIPLLEDSSLVDDAKRDKFKIILSHFTNKYPNLDFSIEAELAALALEDIISVNDNIYVTYDTGNITSCGYDHESYINQIFDKISNVHLKDRTFKGITVPPGGGDTDFSTIFSTLSKKNYEGVFTLQTAREESGNEFFTIERHSQILRSIYEKCF